MIRTNLRNQKSTFGDTKLHEVILDKSKKLPILIDLLNDVSYSKYINSKNFHGETPLHLAVKDFRSDIVEVLLQLNAKPNLQNHKGNTPLHTLFLNFDQDEAEVAKSIVKKLLLKGADSRNILNRDGKSIMDVAIECSYGQLDLVDMVIQAEISKENERIKQAVNNGNEALWVVGGLLAGLAISILKR